ncbi:MAG: glucosaminidase domain-containing protein [Bacilli bacterium]|nr:glucosaminidase domain-containing protein [Bacilli bacterium]
MKKYNKILFIAIFIVFFSNVTILFNTKKITNISKKYLLSKQEFIDKVAPIAVQDMKETGVYASVTLGQAVIESSNKNGWGESKLAKIYNNYFGMTDGECTTSGEVRSVNKSNEYWSGMEVCMCSARRCAWRRVYDSLENSVRDHSRNLWCGNSGKYVKNGVFEAINAKQQLQLIKYSGYASNPNYVSEIYDEIIIPNNFTKYDAGYKKIKPSYANTCTNATYSGTMPSIPDENVAPTDLTTFDGDLKEGYIYKTQLGNAITKADAKNEDGLKNKVFNIISEIFANSNESSNSIKRGAEAYIANVDYLNGSFKNQIVYFNQGDYSAYKYGTYGSIKSHGCGPTSMAIVTSSFLGKNVSPIETTNYACSHGYCTASGSTHAVICALAHKYGLTCSGELSSTSGAAQQQVVNALASGNSLVVVLARKGYFTSGGHFFVLTGVDSSGNITIADPGSRKKTGKTFTFNYLINPTQGHVVKFWIISG